MKLSDDMIRGLILGYLFEGPKSFGSLDGCLQEIMRDFAEIGEQPKELIDVDRLPQKKLLDMLSSLITERLVKAEDVSVTAKVPFQDFKDSPSEEPEMTFRVTFYFLGLPTFTE